MTDEKSCPYEHGTVCTFDALKLSDCQNPKKCKPRQVEKKPTEKEACGYETCNCVGCM